MNENPYASRPIRWLLAGFTLLALLMTAAAVQSDLTAEPGPPEHFVATR